MVRILYGYARKRYNPFFWSNINLQDTALLLSYFLTTKTEIIVPQKDLGAGINCRQLWKKFNQSIKYFTRQIPWIVQPDNANGISNKMPALDKNDNILWNLYKSFNVHSSANHVCHKREK